ncbi:TPA: hypothetical protein MOX26_004389 [Salmonella enterica subsp. enterica serovar Ball]|nr:hypothetical protein [Salmonella enterica subsp. enterica serovar Ball]HCA3488383.1 hypothetical protein [Salmonella enterica subsp. enterica serovar Ball]HCA3563353.1 hypothetical protein [Salmonella enterica subsp. enterica serovar Ball]HCA3582170.1 hypothetical protein [Salmonella enterica subsp. enterica serovar Ball]
MLRADYYHCAQGLRGEQLDRFVTTETGKCTIFMLADGYSSCSEKPHYVDWLAGRLLSLKSSGLHCENTVEEITSLMAQTECYPGKASVAFVVSDERLYYYSTLGDTRIYWPQINSRTVDHSVAQLAVLRGECPPEQLRYHPYRNRLMRHAGSGGKYRLEWQTRPLLKNESMILCSDGLWSQLDDSHLYNVVNSEDLARLVQRLVTVPPPDNLSVVMLSSCPVT